MPEVPDWHRFRQSSQRSTAMKKPVYGILLLMLPSLSQARLNETLEQCSERYGQAIKVKERWRANLDAYEFKGKGGIGVYAGFIDGVAVVLQFEPVEYEQIDVLLKANSGGETWRKLTDSERGCPNRTEPWRCFGREWVRSDGAKALGSLNLPSNHG